MIAEQEQEFTKYEIARILGARALQIAMDAPLLLKISKEKLEETRFDPLKIAELEFNGDVLPITVKRPLPRKIQAKLKREKEKVEKKEEREKLEEKEEKDIRESGEIMEMAKPEDELEDEASVEKKAEESI
tara:strand:+ start:2854 stop:3246 length:393 start_codon:yes stop_codon:yes gene_type:complete